MRLLIKIHGNSFFSFVGIRFFFGADCWNYSILCIYVYIGTYSFCDDISSCTILSPSKMFKCWNQIMSKLHSKTNARKIDQRKRSFKNQQQSKVASAQDNVVESPLKKKTQKNEEICWRVWIWWIKWRV